MYLVLKTEKKLFNAAYPSKLKMRKHVCLIDKFYFLFSKVNKFNVFFFFLDVVLETRLLYRKHEEKRERKKKKK